MKYQIWTKGSTFISRIKVTFMHSFSAHKLSVTVLNTGSTQFEWVAWVKRMSIKQTMFKRRTEIGPASLTVRLFLMVSKCLEDKGKNLLQGFWAFCFFQRTILFCQYWALTQFLLNIWQYWALSKYLLKNKLVN